MRNIPLVILMFAIACNSPSGVQHGGGGSGGTGGGGAGGTGGGGTGGGGTGGTGGGTGGGDNCAAEAKLVYLIDQNGTFSSFLPNQMNPPASVFTDIGKLSCPTKNKKANPFSMSVDRSGTAWVEFITAGLLSATGEMFKVSTKDATCTATSYVGGQQGMEEFGMGFVSDAPGSNQETLYIAGGSGTDTTKDWIGTFSTTTLMVMRGNMISGRPELTGTGKAELWGFFPDVNLGDNMARISQIDKTMGTEVTGSTIMLESKLGGSTATAWAFAFYGGDFWVFLQRQNDPSTIVYYVKSSDGSVQSWAVPGRTIVGAGVSTCAPTTPIG